MNELEKILNLLHFAIDHLSRFFGVMHLEIERLMTLSIVLQLSDLLEFLLT